MSTSRTIPEAPVTWEGSGDRPRAAGSRREAAPDPVGEERVDDDVLPVHELDLRRRAQARERLAHHVDKDANHLAHAFVVELLHWLRALPYVRAWAAKYAGQGLTTIGVHTPEFAFEHGNAFACHIEIFGPSLVKALIRYDPGSDADLNKRQLARLRRLSDYCQISGQRFMLELQVIAPDSSRDRSRRDTIVHRLWIRSALTATDPIGWRSEVVRLQKSRIVARVVGGACTSRGSSPTRRARRSASPSSRKARLDGSSASRAVRRNRLQTRSNPLT